MKNLRYMLVALGLCAVLAPANALAAPILATFDIGGATFSVSSVFLNFNCNPAITQAPCPPPAGYGGNFIQTPGGTGPFAPYDGQGGYLKDLNTLATPLNAPFLLPDWLIYSGTPGNPVIPPDLALDLKFIFLGVEGSADCAAAPAPGQHCTPIGAVPPTAANPLGKSPFNLTNVAGGGSTASFAFAGDAKRISTGEILPFYGTLTSQFTVPYQTSLATILAGGTITNSWSATIAASAIPEPATSFMIGGALLLAGGFLRRRRS